MNIKFAKRNAIDGKFYWYDKGAKIEKELVISDFPVVRVGFNYSGWADGNGVRSNEVTNIAKEEFVICNKDGCIGRGLYSNTNIPGCEINVVVYGYDVNDVDNEFAIMCKGTGYHSLVKALSNIDIDKNMLKFNGVFNFTSPISISFDT